MTKKSLIRIVSIPIFALLLILADDQSYIKPNSMFLINNVVEMQSITYTQDTFVNGELYASKNLSKDDFNYNVRSTYANDRGIKLGEGNVKASNLSNSSILINCYILPDGSEYCGPYPPFSSNPTISLFAIDENGSTLLISGSSTYHVVKVMVSDVDGDLTTLRYKFNDGNFINFYNNELFLGTGQYTIQANDDVGHTATATFTIIEGPNGEGSSVEENYSTLTVNSKINTTTGVVKLTNIKSWEVNHYASELFDFFIKWDTVEWGDSASNYSLSYQFNYKIGTLSPYFDCCVYNYGSELSSNWTALSSSVYVDDLVDSGKLQSWRIISPQSTDELMYTNVKYKMEAQFTSKLWTAGNPDFGSLTVGSRVGIISDPVTEIGFILSTIGFISSLLSPEAWLITLLSGGGLYCSYYSLLAETPSYETIFPQIRIELEWL